MNSVLKTFPLKAALYYKFCSTVFNKFKINLKAKRNGPKAALQDSDDVDYDRARLDR